MTEIPVEKDRHQRSAGTKARRLAARRARAPVLVVAAWLAALAAAAAPLTMSDVLRLQEGGVSEAVIIAQLEATQSTFELTADDILVLRDAGASEALLLRMIRGARLAREPDPAGPDSDPATPPRPVTTRAGEVDLFPELPGPRGTLVVELHDSGEHVPATLIKDDAAERLVLRIATEGANGEREWRLEQSRVRHGGLLVLEHPPRVVLLLPPGPHRVRAELIGVRRGGGPAQVLAASDPHRIVIASGGRTSAGFRFAYERGWSRGEAWSILRLAPSESQEGDPS